MLQPIEYLTWTELDTAVRGQTGLFRRSKRHRHIDPDDLYQAGIVAVLEQTSDRERFVAETALRASLRGMMTYAKSLRPVPRRVVDRWLQAKQNTELTESQILARYIIRLVLSRREATFLIRAWGLDGTTPQGFERACRQVYGTSGQDWQRHLDQLNRKLDRLREQIDDGTLQCIKEYRRYFDREMLYYNYDGKDYDRTADATS